MSKINEAAEVKETAAENKTDTAPAENSNSRNGKPRKNPFRNKKFKYGGLQLKTDAAGIGKLISFAVPLIGDENLEALLGALGSIDFDIKAVFDSFKATAFDETARRA